LHSDARGCLAFRAIDADQAADRQEVRAVASTISNPMTYPHDANAFTAHTVIPSDPEAVRHVQDRIENLLRDRSAADPDVFGIRLAVEEALINAIKHGNMLDRAKNVRVEYRLLADRFEIHISDEGAGFDPSEIPDPTDCENLDRPCGRGLMLMRHYMTEVRYNACGNAVSMSKLLRNGHNHR
jgi:serine/threonine-protein kinase RsbW